MDNFTYTQPVKIYFGCGRFQELEGVLNELGIQKCIIVCDKYFSDKAEELVRGTDKVSAIFCGVEENPQLSGVIETVKLAREHQVDAIVGIGGGSAIDTAKFAAAITKGDFEAVDYYRGTVPFPKDRLPIVTVPTTAGSGSEVTQVSVISYGKEKRTINNPVFMPIAAIIDPELTLSVPKRTTMNTGLDAMAHALEGYWSRNHQPISDLMAIESVRIILDNLEKAYCDGSDLDARCNMSYAALLGGLSFALPKTAASHACSYPLSEDYHLPHGEACAFTLDSFVRINADDRLEYLCQRVGLSGTNELAERICALKNLGGLRTRLSDLENVNLDKLVCDCLAHPLMNNNPVKLDEKTLRALFEALR